MRTLIIIAIGLALLGIAITISKPDRRSTVALGFIAAWLIASLINLGIGLSHGYSLGEELLVHLFLFGIPALAALWVRRRFAAQTLD